MGTLDDNVIALASTSGGRVSHLDAFMYAQRQANANDAALTGFLRANGTERTKVNAILINNPKIYKVLLLNLVQFYGVLNMWVMVCEATCIVTF